MSSPYLEGGETGGAKVLLRGSEDRILRHGRKELTDKTPWGLAPNPILAAGRLAGDGFPIPSEQRLAAFGRIKAKPLRGGLIGQP